MRLHASRAAVIAYAVNVVVIDGDVVNIHVLNDRCVHVGHRAVVVKVAVVPVATIIAVSKVAVSIIDAAVVTNMRPPESGMPEEVPNGNEKPESRRP